MRVYVHLLAVHSQAPLAMPEDTQRYFSFTKHFKTFGAEETTTSITYFILLIMAPLSVAVSPSPMTAS